MKECKNCDGNKKICPFKDYKGKKDNLTGFFIAHKVEGETSCQMYVGFMK